MKKILICFMFFAVGSNFIWIKTADDKYYTLSATVTVKPGQSVNISIKNGLLSVDEGSTVKVPDIVETAPKWMKNDLKLAFQSLSKSPDKIGREGFVSVANIFGKEIITISSTGKKPVTLELPGYVARTDILPEKIDSTARIAFADVNSDKQPDLIVCPKSGGYYYLLGPKFTEMTSQGNVKIVSETSTQLFPLTNSKNNCALVGSPKGFGFLSDNGNIVSCNQDNFVIPLPKKAYGAMSSYGLYFIDGDGDLRFIDKRLTGIADRIPTGFSSNTFSTLPSFKGEVHMAFDKNKIYFASDGELTCCSIADGQLVKSDIKTPIKFGKNLSIQVSDGILYYIDDSSQTIMRTKDDSWSESESVNVFSEGQFAVGDVNNDSYTDLAVINQNKLSILAGPRFDKYIKTIDDWVDEENDKGEISNTPVIKYRSSPAFGDVNGDGKPDLLVGDKSGKVIAFLAPDFDRSTLLDWINVGEFADPQVGDIDGDGNNELLVSNDIGKILCFKKNNSGWQEWNSWSFMSFQSVKSPKDYFNSYMEDGQLVQWNDDPETVNIYSTLLEKCEPRLFDEIAFVVANTPPEILRTMARMGQADILERNAKTIYEYAPSLPYLRIVEKNRYTTIAYKIDGKEYELPRDDYYWYVVHPRISFELPVAINSSWWDKSPDDYGITTNEWLMHEENFFTGKQVFWREAFKDDKTYGESVIDAARRSSTYENAIENVFSLKSLGKDKLFSFGYLTNDLYPWQIYKKHYGSCGENSIILTAMARTALLPCYIVMDQGEDHQWNELWMPDSWRHLEPSSDKFTWDQPWKSTEGEDHKAKTLSTTFGWRADDYIFPTTTTVHNSRPGYTTVQKGYTDTAGVNFNIVDSEGDPVEGGLVIIRTGWNNTNNLSIWDYTDTDGHVHFDLGYEPYYLIDVVTPYGVTGLSNFTVKELEKYDVTLKVPGKVRNVVKKHPKSGNGGTNVFVESIKDEQRPLNFITGRSIRTEGYLSDNFDFKGSMFVRNPMKTSPLTCSIEGKMFDVDEGGRFGLDSSHILTITNETLYTWKTVEIDIDVPVEDYLLYVKAEASKQEVKKGESFELQCNITHSTPIKTIEFSWDNKNWKKLPFPIGNWLSDFKFTINTSGSSVLSVGDNKLFFKCKAMNNGCKKMESIITLPIKVLTDKNSKESIS